MFAIREDREIVSMADFERAIDKVMSASIEKAEEAGAMFA
jgi:ATP-dependent 26S proteasome regulatory subunit